MHTLILYSAYTDSLSYCEDWLDAFVEHPDFRAVAINLHLPHITNKELHARIEAADRIILHYSMTADTLKYLKPLVAALKQRRGQLIAFVGNEVNLLTIGMVPKIKVLHELEADIIVTQLLLEAGQWLYADCTKAKIISLPHALNPKAFCEKYDYEKRVNDIGTRSARYGIYIGDTERTDIIQFFHSQANRYNLKVNLGLEKNAIQRFNRTQWNNFLNSCKATLSTEAGSFYLEKDDIIINNIMEYLQKTQGVYAMPYNNTSITNIAKFLPTFFKRFLRHFLVDKDKIDEGVDFEKINQLFFDETNKCPVYSKAISSRHFDAIGTKTLHIMFPGRYNDILKPWEHYFPLAKDFSNIEDLLALLRNKTRVAEITARAHAYVLKQHTHKHRLDYLLEVM